MLGYQSEEMMKWQVDTKGIKVEHLQNKEIVGLYMIGMISYNKMLRELGMTKEEGRELLEGLAYQLSRNVLRDDSRFKSNIDVWKE